MAARHRQLPTRPGGCLKCLSFQIEAASDETPGGCLSGACSCSTTYGAVQDSARKSVRTELLLDTQTRNRRYGLRPRVALAVAARSQNR